MAKQAVIVVDIQNDYFADGRFPLVGMAEAAAKAALVIADFRARGDLVVHIRHVNEAPEAPLFVAGTVGAEIHERAAPKPGEMVIVKHHVNAFRETALASVLAEADISQITVVGAMSQMCVDSLTRAATDLGFAVTVIHDACAAPDIVFDGVTAPAAHVHAAIMGALAMGFARVISAADYLAAA